MVVEHYPKCKSSLRENLLTAGSPFGRARQLLGSRLLVDVASRPLKSGSGKLNVIGSANPTGG
jgi:hypothetical protein